MVADGPALLQPAAPLLPGGDPAGRLRLSRPALAGLPHGAGLACDWLVFRVGLFRRCRIVGSGVGGRRPGIGARLLFRLHRIGAGFHGTARRRRVLVHGGDRRTGAGTGLLGWAASAQDRR